ncbi:DMT family transporter [Ornithinimicrobium sp. INDO-MA30-4]|uniref:EamA family transporter n=1 Tax=Ornithinimicrobium sp. INDO-MA30-4 TaxID=2908651 RepID=UPI001F34BDA3|nr:DMT family transporter [Ornithinimicrobium sp. INDO-MA30-4]UJH70270.1 DMT family transporter [Ornithinimicrobium sp. INDO-MA30-4]
MDRTMRTGLALALISAATFGTSGALGKPPMESGWSPVAAVTARVLIGSILLAIPAAFAMRGHWCSLRRGWSSIVLFGMFAVALAQVAFYQAVQYIPVGVALLLEYLGIIVVVGYLWLRHGQRPRPLTILGSGLALMGLVLILDVFGAMAIDVRGVLWGLLAAVGLASYFVISGDDRSGVPPVAVATGGLMVGALGLILASGLGLASFEWSTNDVPLAATEVPVWVPLAGIGVFAAALAYAFGVAGARRLGSKLASFVGLTEVMFSVLFAWALLGELPSVMQLLGGAFIVAGVVAVKADERPEVMVKPTAEAPVLTAA